LLLQKQKEWEKKCEWDILQLIKEPKWRELWTFSNSIFSIFSQQLKCLFGTVAFFLFNHFIWVWCKTYFLVCSEEEQKREREKKRNQTIKQSWENVWEMKIFHKLSKLNKNKFHSFSNLRKTKQNWQRYFERNKLSISKI
jgi:hypothetical protein